MKLHKLLSVLLVVCMLTAMLAGCDLDDATTSESTTPETNAITTPQTEAITAPETEATTVPETEAITISETEAITVPETEAITTPKTEANTIPETEAITIPETEAITVPETEAITAPETSESTTPSTPVNANTDSNTTDKYQGITVTKLPYVSKGVVINSVSFSGTRVTVHVTNYTGYAISSLSNISYKCYDSTGTVLKTSNLYLEDLNDGESAEVYFYTESGTTKVLFGDATIYKGEASSDQETAIYDKIAVTKLPYDAKGLTITSISFSGTKATVRVTNNTGYAISSLSNISYKCYDSTGTVLKTSNLYFEALNNGESAEVYFYTESGTTKVLFGDATIYK